MIPSMDLRILSLKNVVCGKNYQLRKAYWIERAVLKFSTVVNHSLVPSEGKRSNPGFVFFCFFQRKSMVKHIAESGLYIPPQKDGYFALFVNSFQIMHLLQL